MSVLPPSPKERLHPRSDLTLQAVNNTPIPTFGTRSLTLNLGLRRTFRWVFIVAETSTPILGGRLPTAFRITGGSQEQQAVQGILSQEMSLSPSLLPRKPASTCEAILDEFPAVTQPSNMGKSIKHTVTHHITTTGPQSQNGCVDSHRRDSRLPVRNFTTCSSWASLDPRRVTGHPHSIWCLRRRLETGVRVATIEHSTGLLSLTAILSHTFRISLCHSGVLQD